MASRDAPTGRRGRGAFHIPGLPWRRPGHRDVVRGRGIVWAGIGGHDMSGNGLYCMADFAEGERWAAVQEAHRRWWAGELTRPLICIYLTGAPSDRPEPDLFDQFFTANHDPSVTAEEIVDRWEYNLSATRFMGDAFPHVWPNYGPGVVAGFLGAGVDPRWDTVWFHAPDDREIADMSFTYDGDNAWLRRVREVSRVAAARWDGAVQVSMTDLGGNLDILASFRPSEKLAMDLIRHGEEVKRLLWEAHELWWRYFDELNAILRPANPGFSTWATTFSAEPHYMFQCDFCYMISPAMFEEFVKPELVASFRRCPHAFYHLDGPGQLRHLDSLLAIEDLQGVQWIPGAGSPGLDAWPEVYRKIRDAGKLVQLIGEPSDLDAVVEQVGSTEGLLLTATTTYYHRDAAAEFLEKYGAL